jgi:hypothetical protein
MRLSKAGKTNTVLARRSRTAQARGVGGAASLVIGFVMLLFAALPAQAQDIAVRSSVSQTALWVGSPVTYTVALSCRPGVDVLQEDLAADRLPVDGLHVVGHSIDRHVANDGRVEYVVTYRLATFEPGAEAVGIRDWVVRYGSGAQTGQTTAARELAIPGVPLAWRSALPGAIAALDLRAGPLAPAAPGWWGSTRSISLTLLALSAVLFAAAIARRAAAGGLLRIKRRAKRTSARDVQSAFGAIRDGDVTDPARRRAAYDDLDATVRRMVAALTTAPAASLTPHELRARLADAPAHLSVDDLARVLEECDRARYQPIDRLPGASDFTAAVEAAQQAMAPAGRRAR